MKEAIARRRALWVLLWRAGRWRLARFGLLVVLQGLMPIVAIVATGMLIGAVPAAIAAGPGSPAEQRALAGLALFGGALAAGAVLAALTDYETQVLNGRYGAAVHQAVAAATLRTRGIAGLADARVAEELAAIEEMERADAFLMTVTSLRQLLVRRASGVGVFVVLLSFAWWAPMVLFAGWRGLSLGVQHWVEQGMKLGSAAGAGGMRRPRYLRSLAMEPAAAKEIRVFGLADWLVRAYADSYRDALRAVWAGRRLGMRTVLVATCGVLFAHSIVLGVLGASAVAGTVSTAQLVVFVQAVLASSAFGYVFGAEVPLARAREVAASTLRLQRLLTDPPPRPEAAASRPAAAAVCVRGVRFTYPGRDRPTLDGFTLTVPTGQSLAIVGTNGAGKSTVIKLLCGLYEPDSGTIEIAGETPVAARDRISAIFQNFTRYALPLRDNVGLGDPATPHELPDLAAALGDAGAGDLVAALPRGWDTVLAAGYPGGHDLSGGQWQKVALARALVAVRGGAELLLMDEPTASLDVRAETELFDRFLDLTRGGVTTILVSHRLASVRRTDRIVVLADGRVIEDGTHAELMAADGRYAKMFALQASRFIDEPAPGLVDAERGPAA